MMHNSFNNEDCLLDVPFVSEEVDSVLKLKLGKAAGHDGVQAEHLKYGGPILRDWILQICNAITELEHVPDFLKTGIITPLYKGGGKDPLDTHSYRGVTLTSVLAKGLESLILTRSKPVESTPIAVLGGEALTARLSAKCLGYWWSWDLSATKAVDYAIKKARRAFFAFGAMEGETSTTSHLVGFRVSPFCTAKVCTVSICSCKVARELLMVRMSSA